MSIKWSENTQKLHLNAPKQHISDYLIAQPGLCFMAFSPKSPECGSNLHQQTLKRRSIVFLKERISYAHSSPERNSGKIFGRKSQGDLTNAVKFLWNFSLIFVLQFPGKLAAWNFTQIPPHIRISNSTRLNQNSFTAILWELLGRKFPSLAIAIWFCEIRVTCALSPEFPRDLTLAKGNCGDCNLQYWFAQVFTSSCVLLVSSFSPLLCVCLFFAFGLFSLFGFWGCRLPDLT